MELRLALASLVLLVGCPRFSFAQQDAKKGEPLDRLPKQVQAARGELTLFADFAAKTEKGVPVYLVNRTGKPLSLRAQDGDLYLKLEYEVFPGKWVRAEPHAYSWCGNSYYQRELADDAWILVQGYYPAEGDRATVRYAFYGQQVKLHSNRALALVNKEDVRKAAQDAMAVQCGDFTFVRQVALGELKLKNEMDHMRDMRLVALWRLGSDTRFDRAQVERLLQTIENSREHPYAQEATEQLRYIRQREEQPK